MNILNFEKKHVKEATEIALANYNDERKSEKINSFDEDKNFYKQFELCDGYKGKKPY